MHIKLTNGIPTPYSIGQLRRDNPQTSFPKNIPDNVLAEFNVYPLQTTERPAVDHTENITEETPVQLNGQWVQVWNVTDATVEEISARTKIQEENVREQRNQKLTETDWTQLSDTSVNKYEWAEYRQALRNIPQQVGFPWNVIWPEKPNK